MAKKSFGRPKCSPLPVVVNGVEDALRPEELEEMLQAGDGLFWRRRGEQITLYSPEIVRIGVEAMWELWERINDLLPETKRGAHGTVVSTRAESLRPSGGQQVFVENVDR